MNIDHLRYFLVLTQEMHYGRAAQRLNISQSGLSHAMAALEQELARHTLHFRQQSGFAGEDHCEYVYTVFLPRRRTAGDFAAQMTGVAGVQQANWVRG